MDFSYFPLRFHFRAVEEVSFRPAPAANILRGGLGWMLKEHAPDELYRHIFEPGARAAGGPSGLKDWPRPFVLRAAHLDGKSYAAGESFAVDVNLFDVRSECFEAIRDAFMALGAAGFGLGRGRADLASSATPEIATVQLAPDGPAIGRIWLEILTPLELKNSGEVSNSVEFGLLFARIRDRVSTLRALYGPGPLDIDFRGMAARADRVRIVESQLTCTHPRRRSSRTGQTHEIGGVTGGIQYAGDMRKFVPYLRAAEVCGVGRQCVWGKGHIRVKECK